MASYQATVLADSPVFFFPMQEASGSIHDSTSNAFTGAPTGTLTYRVSTGLLGLPFGITFGGNAWFDITDAAALRITGDFSLEAWIKLNSFSNNSQIYDKGTQSYTGYTSTAGSIVFAASSVANYYISTGSLISLNTLYHVVHTRTGNSETGYINGAAASGASGSSSQAALGNSGTNARIGATTGNANPTLGLMAGVAIYNAGLTLTQVQNHYNARNNTAGGGPGKGSPPGAVVAALAHDRNQERKQGQGSPGSHHLQRISDYYRRKTRQ